MKPFNLEEYLANPNKKLVTRDGRKVTKVLCTNAKGYFPIVALVESFDGKNETAIAYTNKGHLFDGADYSPDLFFAPEKCEGWINLYSGKLNGSVFNSKEEAIGSAIADASYIATVKVEWEE